MAPKTRTWHREDIKAAIRKRGTTLTRLAVDHGLCESAVRVALVKPSYQAEQVIAGFIDIPAPQLWPERYDADGTPRHPQARKYLIAGGQSGHRQKSRAA